MHYGFPSKVITDQGRNFESELIENLCHVAGVKKLRTSPYHPQDMGQCENTLKHAGDINTRAENGLEKSCPCPGSMHTTALNMQPLGIAHTISFGREPRLPVDVEFGLQKESQKGPLGESGYVSQIRRRLMFAHNKAKQMAKRQQA